MHVCICYTAWMQAHMCMCLCMLVHAVHMRVCIHYVGCVHGGHVCIHVCGMHVSVCMECECGHVYIVWGMYMCGGCMCAGVYTCGCVHVCAWVHVCGCACMCETCLCA